MPIFHPFANRGGFEDGDFPMKTFQLDEQLSNVLHALAAVPFGLAFILVFAAQFLVHAA
jgi:hypothetical protein